MTRRVLTTEEVSAMVARRDHYVQDRTVGERTMLRDVALPLAERVAALEAEIATLKTTSEILNVALNRSMAKTAQLAATLACATSPYGVHRCCHCDMEVTCDE